MVRVFTASQKKTTQLEGLRTGRRKAPRLRLSIPARLVTLHDERRCILIDLSCTGARVGLQEPLSIGDGAVLRVATLAPFGDVVRYEKGEFGGVNGLVFDPPLANEQVLAVREFSETYQEEEIRALRSEVRKWVIGT